jgi:serine/threonine-protein kinase
MRIAGYEILRELERGGMGRVLLARRLGAHGFERLVAIKTIAGDNRAQNLVSMFLDEAKLMARLHHAAIAQVFDLVEHEGELCLVMEYVSGISFSKLAERRPPPRVCVEALALALRGLHAAHELRDEQGELLGVVHRDVSPQNLMLSFDGRVKILDFGIAWMRGRSAPLTELGTIKGKPAYMAPEQLAGEAVDRRTDVYSAAVVLHELLTGKPLFMDSSPFAVAHAIASGRIDPPSASIAHLPRELDCVVMRGLARDPRERFPSAEAMALALEGLALEGLALEGLEGEPLDAWTRRELAGDRQTHQSGLSQITDGRPTGVATIVEPAATTDVSASIPITSHRGRAFAAILGALVVASLVVLLPRWFRNDPAPTLDVETSIASASPNIPESASLAAPSEPAPSEPAPSEPAPSASAPMAPRARVTPATSASATTAPSAVAVEHGFLTVAAEPYALVELDGTSLGPTPIFARRVPVGPHTVVLISPDTGKVRTTRAVRVESGKTATVHAR